MLAIHEHVTVHASYSKKRLVSNSPGLVDFAMPLVNFILNLPNVQDSEIF